MQDPHLHLTQILFYITRFSACDYHSHSLMGFQCFVTNNLIQYFNSIIMNLLVSVKKGESRDSNSTTCEGERHDRCDRRRWLSHWGEVLVSCPPFRPMMATGLVISVAWCLQCPTLLVLHSSLIYLVISILFFLVHFEYLLEA